MGAFAGWLHHPAHARSHHHDAFARAGYACHATMQTKSGDKIGPVREISHSGIGVRHCSVRHLEIYCVRIGIKKAPSGTCFRRMGGNRRMVIPSCPCATSPLRKALRFSWTTELIAKWKAVNVFFWRVRVPACPYQSLSWSQGSCVYDLCLNGCGWKAEAIAGSPAADHRGVFRHAGAGFLVAFGQCTSG